ncbi:MAG: rhodanese-like domain-containing protein [Gemmatimonadaceae bacterium]|nr:rhodanese-like domain-containing protein [Gemmatimonadaceae bacterium]
MSFFSSLASLLGASSFGPDEFDALTAQHPAAILLDVRTRNEYVQGHIDGSTLVPLDQLPTSLKQIAEAAVPVVIICHSGSRASSAASALRRAGKQDVHVLAGGVSYWASQRRRLIAGAKDIPLRDALKKAKKAAAATAPENVS